ncbi:MAG: hypothetical protein R3B48_29955 [Kofleriaceae bacterium]
MLLRILEAAEARAEILSAPLDQLRYWAWGLHVRQCAPSPNAHQANLEVRAGHEEEVVRAQLAGRDERTQSFFRIEERPGGLQVRLHTDMLYNPYAAYLQCLLALAPSLHDATFQIIGHEEDDDGRVCFVVDHFEVRAGALLQHRIYSEYGVGEVGDDEARLFAALDARFPSPAATG